MKLSVSTRLSQEPQFAVSDVLDALVCPALVVDRASRIEWANAGGRDAIRDVLHEAAFFGRRSAGTGFSAASDGAHALPTVLRHAIGDALANVHPAGAVRTSACILRIADVSAGPVVAPTIARVRPLGPARQIDGRPAYARALVTIPLARDLAPRDACGFADAYGLTEAEIRVLVTLANGLSQQDCAQLLEISPATLRTHLKHIFDKTGMRRQSQLVSLFLRTLSPLRR